MSATNAFYNYIVNPVMRKLLNSSLHGIVSKNIAILYFTGKRSGRALSTPLSYAREGNTVRFLSSQNTRWWRNFRGADAPVSVEIARERFDGSARLLEGESPEFNDGVARFINAVPRDAVIYGLKLDGEKKLVTASLAAKADHVILVEVTLDNS
ncbi:MAG: nitroreductase/quinone reductase family protein [Pseudomonadota bacterium]